MEQTCILVKPDGVCKNVANAVLDRFAKAGLTLSGLKILKLSRSQAEAFYKEHQGKPFYEPLVQFMTSAPIVASVWSGEGAVAKARGVMGATNSTEAASGTIRREFGTNNRYNVVHGSDSPASAEREIPFFFKREELFQYSDMDWKIDS